MITRRRVLHFGVLFALVFFVAPSLVMAQTPSLPTIVPDSCNGIGGCQSVCDLATLAQHVLTAGIFIAVFLAAFLFAWAGFKYLTNVGNSGEVARAKEVFMNVAIGLVIILAGWLVVDTLIRTLTGAKLGVWNKICELLIHAGPHLTGLA